jgi:hypothetical protein
VDNVWGVADKSDLLYGASMAGKEKTIAEMTVGMENPKFQAALKRAQELVKKAQFNEAIVLIEDLESEVETMVIARRYSRIKKPSESSQGINIQIMNPALKGLSEAEYVRQTILIELRNVKNTIITATQRLQDIVIEIEATKTN